jgi:hypothetical protein
LRKGSVASCPVFCVRGIQCVRPKAKVIAYLLRKNSEAAAVVDCIEGGRESRDGVAGTLKESAVDLE